jgi:hypothetical protein
MFARIVPVIWGSPLRRLVTVLCAVFVVPVWQYTVGVLLQMQGWDVALQKNAPPIWSFLAGLASSHFKMFLLGAAVALLGESLWRSLKRKKETATDLVHVRAVTLPQEKPAEPTPADLSTFAKTRRALQGVQALEGIFSLARKRADRTWEGNTMGVLEGLIRKQIPAIESNILYIAEVGLPVPQLLKKFDMSEIAQLEEYMRHIKPFLDNGQLAAAAQRALSEANRIDQWIAMRNAHLASQLKDSQESR